MISQAEEGGACSGKWWEGVGTCPSAQASRDWAIQLSQRPCRWSGLQEYVFEECLPVALTGFLNSHRFLAFEICFHCSSPFSHKVSVSVQSLSRVWLCDPMNCSTPGLPVHHQLPGFTQIHLHWVGDAMQISSTVVPFSSCPQSFPASGSLQMSHLFSSGGQSIGVSASASVLPMNIQDWFPLGWTGWSSLQSRGFSRVFSNTTVQKVNFTKKVLFGQLNSNSYSLSSLCHLDTRFFVSL